MKHTYNCTTYFKDLTKAIIELHIYEGFKYDMCSKEATIVRYTGVKKWDIISGGIEAKEIEAMTDANSFDEFHEYLVLHFENGDTATFFNSHVDMFIK